MKGYGTPVVVHDRPILGARYGVHWNYAPPDGSACRRDEATPRNISGIVINTPKGAIWLFFRRWKYRPYRGVSS